MSASGVALSSASSSSSSASSSSSSTNGEISRPAVKDLLISNQFHGVIIRPPGSLNGADFSIEECDCVSIFIADHTSQITVDFVSNSILFFGPIEGSLFLRDCKNCRILVFCQQFRCRNIENCDVYLFCTTKSPIIESSHHVRFYPLSRLSYAGLTDQFVHSKLNPKAENFYSAIYDFTPEEKFEDIPKPHFEVKKETPKNIFLKFSSEEIAELPLNEFAIPLPEGVTQTQDGQWATPWDANKAPPLAQSWIFKKEPEKLSSITVSPVKTVRSVATPSAGPAPAIFGELPALTVSFPVGTAAVDANAIMAEFAAELLERERSQSNIRAENETKAKEEQANTAGPAVALQKIAARPSESNVSLAVSIDSAGQLHISTASAVSSSDLSAIVLVESHVPAIMKAETLDSLVSSAIQMEVTEATVHTKPAGASSAPSSSPPSPKAASGVVVGAGKTDDDWIKSHALYLHENAVDDSALRRLDEIRAKYLEAKSAQEQSMKEAIRAIAQQQLADVAKFFEERRAKNQQQNREEETKLKEEHAKKQERMIRGEMSEEESWSEITQLIDLEKTGVRDEQDIDRIRGIYLALREKRKQSQKKRQDEAKTSPTVAIGAADSISHPLLLQLASDLVHVDEKNSDAAELKEMSLVEFQHYTAEELETILQPLSRKQKLKYRALHQGKLDIAEAAAAAQTPADAIISPTASSSAAAASTSSS